MIGYLIDPFERKVSLVDSPTWDFEAIRDQIGCDYIDAVRIWEGDRIWVDDEGLLNLDLDRFCVTGYPFPIAGKGLVTGVDGAGVATDPIINKEVLEKKIGWGVIW